MIDTDVVVVGAGPTGLTLACGLRLHGVDVRVIDRASGPATTSRANFLHARGSEVLARIGALGSLPDESLRAMRVTNYLGDRPLATLEFGDPQMHTAAPPMVVSQAKVEATLRARLADLGAAPEWATALTGLRNENDGVVAELENGTTIRARWLVGCDGTSSTTRQLAGIAFPGVKLTERWLLADLRMEWDVDRTGTTGWVHPAGLVGAMPMPDESSRDNLWRIFAYDPDLGRRPDEHDILDRLREILPERTGRQPDIFGADWLSVFTVHRRLADHYRKGRVFLAGDAAHAHAPFGGQGMLTGVGDAENLSFKLALVVKALAEEPLLNSYEAERRPLATEVLRGTSAVTRVNVASHPVGRFLRDRVAARIFRLPIVQRWTTYTASQLWVSYRKGPLGGSGDKPRRGDRVPDVPCRRADGSPATLHRELAGRFVLLIPADATDPAGFETARSHLGEFVTALHHDKPEMWLIRPDAHLAWRGAPAETSGLARWLTDALRTGRAR